MHVACAHTLHLRMAFDDPFECQSSAWRKTTRVHVLYARCKRWMMQEDQGWTDTTASTGTSTRTRTRMLTRTGTSTRTSISTSSKLFIEPQQLRR